MTQKLLALALAGGLGTLARYGLGGLVQRWLGAAFPWGTFVVNAFGCLLFGLFWALAGGRLSLSGDVRSAILVGFLGAFTTFSTLMAESGQLLGQAGWALSLANVLLHNVAGIGLFFVGLSLGKLA